MNLYLHISIHILLALLAGFIAWKLWKKPFLAFFFALLSGVAIDFDHFIDYFLAFGFHFDLDYFIKGYSFLKTDKMYVLFHGWEYVGIFLILTLIFRSRTLKTIFFALALGAFFHLVADVIIDGVPIKSYSIVYRIKNNFNLEKLATPEHWQEHLSEKNGIEID